MFRTVIFLIFIVPNFMFSQIEKVKTTPEDFQFMSWSIKDFEKSKNNFNYSIGKSFKNNLHNKYFFEYIPVYRDKTKLVGYSLKFNNTISGEERWIGIPFINPNELQNLFEQIMGWTTDERDAFLKSYLLFINSNLLQ